MSGDSVANGDEIAHSDFDLMVIEDSSNAQLAANGFDEARKRGQLNVRAAFHARDFSLADFELR